MSEYDTELMQLRELLAKHFHDAWWEWSETIADEEAISDERLDRWMDYWVEYEELPESVKTHDREYANAVISDLSPGVATALNDLAAEREVE